MADYRNQYQAAESANKDVKISSKIELTYDHWKEEHENLLSDLGNKKTIMLFTGGKDSSIILHYLQLASEEFGFSFEAHAADYPQHVFTDEEKAKLNDYWGKREVNIVWHSIPESDEIIEASLTNSTNFCYICHKVKRKALMNFINSVNQNLKQEIVIILSYTLWDIVSYSLEYITGSVYADPNSSHLVQGKSAETRFTETSQRFYPLIQLAQGLTIFKPLLKYNDSEISHAVENECIPLSSVECKYMKYRPKRMMSNFYKNLELRFDYDSVFDFANKVLGLRDIDYYKNLDMNQFLEKLI